MAQILSLSHHNHHLISCYHTIMVCVYPLEQTLQLCFFLLCALEVDEELDKVALELGCLIKVLKVQV